MKTTVKRIRDATLYNQPWWEGPVGMMRFGTIFARTVDAPATAAWNQYGGLVGAELAAALDTKLTIS